jgi:serine/threonine protein kinase
MVGRIIGNYQITDELGHGGLGVIYRGHHINLPRDVVIKEVSLSHFPISTRVQLKALFRRETFIQAQLDHPGIARLYESFYKADNYYLVLEYVSGVSLRELLQHQGLPTPAQAIYLCKQALTALDYAHHFKYLTESDVQRKGVIHRDIKPSNLLVDGRGRLKITDFGIVKMPEKQSMAPPSFRPGTAEYMPPEQLRGLDLDARSDVYSLGVTLYEMLTGHLPHSRPNKGEEDDLRKSCLDQGWISISDIRSDVSAALSSILMRAIVKNPGERFQSAAEFLKALKEYERNSGPLEIPQSLLIGKMIKGSPETVTIVEIGAKPELPAGAGSPLTSFATTTQPPSTPQAELQNQRQTEVSTDPPDSHQITRQQPGVNAESSIGTPSEALQLSPRFGDLNSSQQQNSQSLVVNRRFERGNQNQYRFEYTQNSSRGSKKVLIAAAAVFLGVFLGAYFLIQRQGGAKMTAPELESGVTANVASAVATANAATPQPEATTPPVNTGDLAKLEQAREADGVGKFKQAVTLYEEYLQSGPNDAEAAAIAEQLARLRKFITYFNAARGAYNRGNYLVARRNYAEALKLRPYSRVAQNGLARSLARISGSPVTPSGDAERSSGSESNPIPPR